MATATAAATTILSLILLSLLLLSPQTLAQTAPAPAPPGPVNLTAILEKNGQFTIFIRLLKSTQVDNEVENQLNSSSQGLTVFAPTDNAFDNLKPGTINNLSPQQQSELVLYHILPEFYNENNLLLVSNPVRTQAADASGVYVMNITGQANQLNVSTGIVETQINNVLRQDAPLAVYQVDKVLLPEQLFGVKPPTAAPPPPPASKTTSSGTNSTTAASEPSPSANGVGGRNVAVQFVVGLGLLCMGILSS